ncbi:hypothetical protein [Symbiopectobacterium purcellii]|uniref:hypothetical protein n=1 Tax=Symbiopectobacterium purcellii TaxID=2871826 RepID=UPI003F834721
MKYFTVTYVSQKTLHPDGYKTFTSFVAADTKHAAKLKSLEVLSQEDPACCMMYKVPRLDEISEGLGAVSHDGKAVDGQAAHTFTTIDNNHLCGCSFCSRSINFFCFF